MAFRLTLAIALGSSKTGLTLKAQLKDPAGTNVGSAVTTGFVEHGVGNYSWDYAAYPDGFRGIVQILDNGSSALYAIAQVNPEELNTTGAGSLTTAEREAIADAILNRNVAGGSNSGRLVKQALYFLRNRWTISAGTLSVYGTDDSTVSWTATVGRSAENPVVSVDAA